MFSLYGISPDGVGGYLTIDNLGEPQFYLGDDIPYWYDSDALLDFLVRAEAAGWTIQLVHPVQEVLPTPVSA